MQCSSESPANPIVFSRAPQVGFPLDTLVVDILIGRWVVQVNSTLLSAVSKGHKCDVTSCNPLCQTSNPRQHQS